MWHEKSRNTASAIQNVIKSCAAQALWLALLSHSKKIDSQPFLCAVYVI